MIYFKVRSAAEEAMDNPFVGSRELEAVFSDLRRTNLLLGGQRLTLGAVFQLMRKYPRENYRIVDMGCGDGDMLRRVALRCRKLGQEVELLGVDNNTAALEIAGKLSSAFQEINFTKASLPLPGTELMSCDILLCSLTLHHFHDRELPVLLNQFAQMAGTGVVINDLQRNRLAYALFQVFSRIFIKTKIARQDGLISIRRGFLKPELWALSRAIPEMEHHIQWRWIFRYLWVMQAKAIPPNE